MKSKRGDIAVDTLIPWMIGLVVLVIVVILYLTLNEKGSGAISFIKNIFRFG